MSSCFKAAQVKDLAKLLYQDYQNRLKEPHYVDKSGNPGPSDDMIDLRTTPFVMLPVYWKDKCAAWANAIISLLGCFVLSGEVEDGVRLLRVINLCDNLGSQVPFAEKLYQARCGLVQEIFDLDFDQDCPFMNLHEAVQEKYIKCLMTVNNWLNSLDQASLDL